MAKIQLTEQQREFQKVRRFVEKRAPGARTMAKGDDRDRYYVVVDGNGRSTISQELMLPPARTVIQAWQQAKYSLWFTSMMRKNTVAFSDEKIFKKLAKEKGSDDE